MRDGRALGVRTRLAVTAPTALAAAADAVDRVLADVDATYSRFRADSELSSVNAAAGRRVTISRLLTRAIGGALRAARLTGGAVDPTIGRALRIAGYDRSFEAVDPDGPALRLVAEAVPGWQLVELDERRSTVRVPAGVELDLGATGKGLAADLAAAAALKAAGAGGVLVSLGGDIAVAGEPPPGGWSIQVGDDSSAPVDAAAETVSLLRGGLATSSTTVRRWTRGGVELHHILDPATGLPAATPWRTASAVAETCEDANAIATAAIVIGERAVGWLAEVGLPARLVRQDGAVQRLGGWPSGRAGRRHR